MTVSSSAASIPCCSSRRALTPGNTNADVDWWQFQEVSRLPENWNWTLSVQRELPGKFLVEASYNASVGIHLMSGLLNVNQLDSSIYPTRVSIRCGTYASTRQVRRCRLPDSVSRIPRFRIA